MELLKSVIHPEEVMAMLKWKLKGSERGMSKCDFINMSPSLKTCYDLLNKTSRSYATVIQTLDGDLRSKSHLGISPLTKTTVKKLNSLRKSLRFDLVYIEFEDWQFFLRAAGPVFLLLYPWAPMRKILSPSLRLLFPKNAVCIFYLVMRALDTVEDDMTIPLAFKIPMLKSFYNNLLDPYWKYTESKDKDKIVLEQFPSISKEFRKLDKKYQEIISDICQKSGEGITEFLLKNVDTIDDWNKYCHYVAGLVGIGLAKIFSASGLEDPAVGQSVQLANDFGTLSQKTNLIKDFFEDLSDNRIFWPKAVWSKYVADLGYITKIENQAKAVQCLNELITNALEHIPSCLKVVAILKDLSILTFVAIPQVVAIATLERCYNNPNVFTGVVKIRKGEAVRILLGATSVEKVKAIVKHYILRIIAKIPSNDPNSAKTRAICQKVLALIDTQQEYTTSCIFPTLFVSLGLMLTTISYTYWSQISQWYEDMF